MKKDVITFGCRLNAYESEIIRKNIGNLDNVAVFNTCTVTKEAERQAKQAIRKYNRENPDVKIIVTGCGSQIDPEGYTSLAGVEKVVKNNDKLKRESYDPAPFSNAEHVVFSEKSRAFLQVQNGCDHRCTFCIIPFGRGKSRSIPINDIIKQGKTLVSNGYNEIILTGVDLTDYGKGTVENLGSMIKQLLEKVQIPRVRLSSIDIAEIDDNLLDLIKNEQRLMPHLHLSLQSGDNMILKRMARRHTREQILEFCDDIRNSRPDIVFGADIIAGFPTETDKMFENTLNLIKETGIIHLHVFPYSERKNTPAANISNKVAIKIRKKRASILRKIGKENLAQFLKSRIGKTEKILVETKHTGRTEHFAIVKISGKYVEKSIADISVNREDGEFLYEI